MNRRVVVPTLLVCAAPWLGGCQATDAIVDYFGPHADPTLTSLAHDASADAHALQELDPDAASLRAQHADELYSEIERLCGRDEEGHVPRSCEVNREGEAHEATDAAAVLAAASSSTEEQLDAVSPESRPLLVAQAIAMKAHSTDEPGAVPELTEDDADLATELLDWEYQQVYALDFARSYVTPDVEELVDERLALHENRVLALQEAVAKIGPVPQPAAAYTSSSGELPVDAASARAFLDDVAHSDTVTWASAASQEAPNQAAPNAEWRSWLISVAAQSHRISAA